MNANRFRGVIDFNRCLWGGKHFYDKAVLRQLRQKMGKRCSVCQNVASHWRWVIIFQLVRNSPDFFSEGCALYSEQEKTNRMVDGRF